MSEILPYNNALSDRLVVCYFPSHSIFTVYNKDLLAKWQTSSNTHDFPAELQEAIFSETHVVRVLNKSTLAPLGESEYEAYFNVNFGKGFNIATQDSELFTVVYEDVTIPYSTNLVSARETTDIDVVYRFASQKNYTNALYFYHANDEVTIWAWRDGQFVLANRYAADNEDELFYYVMLVVEQLELPANDIHFALLGTRTQHTAYHSLFQNYLSPLHLSNLEQGSDATIHTKLADFFGKCVL